ncbi:MAG TPA: SAM-dependent methyltransferase [Rectinemataceae bacterium]|nr:SAM-dependent methyltransferase [Rectinemataceae bacterium]
MNRTRGRLYLLPNLLDERDSPEASIPAVALDAFRRIRRYVVEGEKSAWRLLSRILDRVALDEVRLDRLDEHSDPRNLPDLLLAAETGEDIGLLSEAGVPCIADPGGALVALAHDRGITVVPTGGPSSLLLALSASGLDGQRFSFLGYLPQDQAARRAALATIDRSVAADGGTMIFIETPYRNTKVVEDCLSVLSPARRLCVAASLGSPEQRIRSCSVKEWKEGGWRPGKEAAIFLVGRVPGISLDRPFAAGHSKSVCKNRRH